MQKYIIKGGKKLEGTVKISGSKNASLPIIAASILNRGKTVLYNVPNIHDTQMMFEILKEIGGKVEKKKNKIIIDTSKINKYKIPDELMRQMRSSVILAGSLIGTYKTATFSYPGGCDIGTRPIDLHLKGFEKLGINITKNYGNIICICDRILGASKRWSNRKYYAFKRVSRRKYTNKQCSERTRNSRFTKLFEQNGGKN